MLTSKAAQSGQVRFWLEYPYLASRTKSTEKAEMIYHFTYVRR
jgi:hypothetical protein